MQRVSGSQELLKLGLVGSAGILGAYYLDPDMGRHRRALLRDKVGKSTRNIRHQGDLLINDARQRAQGSLHELLARFKEHDFDDQVIHDRIKAVIGHYCSHPSAIDVEVHDRHVDLSGDILRRDLMPLLWAVSTVRGVKRVHNFLTVHKSKNNISSLQGGPRRLGFGPMSREYWPPTYRFAFGAIGAGLVSYGFNLEGSLRAGAVAAGALLLTRTTLNKRLKRIFGIGVGADVIHVQKTVTIRAPVAKVFDTWRHPENFPTFMRNVHKVEKLGENRYRWVVKGPVGTEVEWTSSITEEKPNKLLVWHSVPGSIIEQAGKVYLEDQGDSTVVHIQIAYNPPAGAFGHLIAYLFRVDPKSDLDEDMIRMKTMVETGKRPRDAYSRTAAGS